MCVCAYWNERIIFFQPIKTALHVNVNYWTGNQCFNVHVSINEIEKKWLRARCLNGRFPMYVAAAQAKILGPEDVYVKKGSTISLTCTVNVQSTPPSSVSWHHGGAVVDFDSPRYKPRESSSRVRSVIPFRLKLSPPLVPSRAPIFTLPRFRSIAYLTIIVARSLGKFLAFSVQPALANRDFQSFERVLVSR